LGFTFDYEKSNENMILTEKLLAFSLGKLLKSDDITDSNFSTKFDQLLENLPSILESFQEKLSDNDFKNKLMLDDRNANINSINNFDNAISVVNDINSGNYTEEISTLKAEATTNSDTFYDSNLLDNKSLSLSDAIDQFIVAIDSIEQMALSYDIGRKLRSFVDIF
jgi:hypothetical protein